MKVTVIPKIVGELGKEAGEIGNQKKNRDHPDCKIIRLIKNIQKSPEDLWRQTAKEQNGNNNTEKSP